MDYFYIRRLIQLLVGNRVSRLESEVRELKQALLGLQSVVSGYE